MDVHDTCQYNNYIQHKYAKYILKLIAFISVTNKNIIIVFDCDVIKECIYTTDFTVKVSKVLVYIQWICSQYYDYMVVSCVCVYLKIIWSTCSMTTS